MTQATATDVRRQVTVEVPIEEAFTAFTERFGDFKPPEHNLLSTPIAQTVFEPRVGVTSSIAGSTAASVAGLASSPTNLRSESCSAGTSAPPGGWRRTRRTPARLRCAS
jgi:hypothetical protein